MKQKVAIDTTLDLGQLGEHEFTVEANYYPGRPARWPSPSCETGEPPEPAEVEILSVKLLAPHPHALAKLHPCKRKFWETWRELNFLPLLTDAAEEWLQEEIISQQKE